MARLRKSTAWARVASSTLIASRRPWQRGSLTPWPARTWRAAPHRVDVVALGPHVPGGTLGHVRLNDPLAAGEESPVEPAPKLPVPSIAHSRASWR